VAAPAARGRHRARIICHPGQLNPVGISTASKIWLSFDAVAGFESRRGVESHGTLGPPFCVYSSGLAAG
jgi:hypothetical protein